MEVLEKISANVNNSYFDAFGRCNPNQIKAPFMAKSRRYFALQQPEIDYQKIHARLTKHLGIDARVTYDEFSCRAEKILDELRENPVTRNILKGVHVPFMLPIEKAEDIGTLMDTKYLPAVEASFKETFADKSFTNHHKGNLAGKLAISLGSRHERLLKAQQREVLVGYYFPCLTEFSVPAAIEQLSHLPEKFLLAGGVDTAAAMIAAPELLLRKDGYPPLLWLAALDTEKAGVGYHFEAYGYHLTFNRRVHFDQAAESWASGLVVLG